MYQYFKRSSWRKYLSCKNNDEEAKKRFLSYIKFLLQDKYDETIEDIIKATYNVAKHKGCLETND